MKKKILFVMNTMGRAGAERALIAFMRTLPEDTYDLSLLSLINRGELFEEVPKHVHILNKKPNAKSILNTGGTFTLIKRSLVCFFYHGNGFRLLPYLIKNLRQQIKRKKLQPDKLLWRLIAYGCPVPNESYDLAIAYLEGGSTYFVADRVSAGKKAAFVHIDYEKAGYTKDLDLDCYASIDRIFSVSKEAGESFLSIYPEYKEKMFLFRNIIDRDHIKKQSLKPILSHDAFTRSNAQYKLLTVGRLAYQKAYDIAVPALKIIRERGYDAEWFVIGEGSLKDALQKQIKKEGMEQHFHLLGGRQNPYPYYRAATLYVHATRFEGKSIAIEEAQVLNKAIIASDCTGNREQIIPDKTGLLIPLTAPAIADAITFVLTNPDKRQAFEQALQNIDLSHPEDRRFLLELLEE